MIEARALTRDEWVAQALRCYDEGQLPNVCWDNIFVALCEEVCALRLELDGRNSGTIDIRGSVSATDA